MDATVGRETDVVAFLAELAQAPHRYDFYQTLRRLECFYREKPRWGCAPRPVDEPVRLGQDPELSFAPSPLAAFEGAHDGTPPRLQVRVFGLLGPNGPLPLHLTEYTRERLRHAGDPTLARFLDIFNHRFLALFYRAWAQAQPHVNRDRPDADQFAGYLGAFFGVLPATFRNRDSTADVAKLFHVGTLARQVRNADGLAAILRHFFRVPVAIRQFVGHWMLLGDSERTRLGRDGAVLGARAVVGGRVWDRQHKFRIHLGPLTRPQYESFLPSAAELQVRPLQQLVDWVRLYLGLELEWDVRLSLRKEAVPRLELGRGARLGWTTWLGRRRVDAAAADLCLNAERFVARPEVCAA
jgi:type VI secretion system protein ImpH